MLREDLARALRDALGEAPRSVRALGGGDVCEAFALGLRDGREVFLKTRADADPELFPCEARGLAWLAEARASRVPEVLAVSEKGGPPFLVLEMIRPGPRAADFDERLGRELAALHAAGAPAFGHAESNFIGPLPQDNAVEPDAATFLRRRRHEPMLALAARRGRLPKGLSRRFDRLHERLDDLVGPPEPPARLHGDLWSGNLLVGPAGEPVLIDPAVHGGHREVDLAMMRLFGGFSERVHAAYDEVHPLAPDAERRVGLWQLHPLLVHLVLFGEGYVPSLERALDGLGVP